MNTVVFKKTFVLFVLLSISLVAGVVQPITTTSTMQTKAQPSGKCAIGNFISSPSTAQFENLQLVKGIKNIKLPDLKQETENRADISGFKCPKLSSIKDPSIPKDDKVTEVVLSNINFASGSYTCRYNFANTQGAYVINLFNDGCKDDTNVILKMNLKNLPIYQYANYYGLSSLDNHGAINFTNEIKKLDNYLKMSISDEEAYKKEKRTGINIKEQINSHTNFANTLPSVITGILTLDTNFFKNSIIAQNGDLQLKKSYNVTQEASSVSTQGDKIDISNSVASLTSGINKKVWGFYYYLLNNISSSFEYIMRLIFGLGTIGIFGYAYIKKLYDHKKILDFNFTRKLIGIIGAFIVFSAPIVPTTKGVPQSFLYSSAENQTSKNNNTDAIIAKNSTIVDSLMRYGFQEGTFWANTLNDYALYSYLKFFETSYGVFDTSKVMNNFKTDVKTLLLKNILLKKKMNFFEKTCAYNYYGQLANNYTLPDYNHGSMSGILMFDNNPLGYQRVDYNTCSKIYNEISRDTASGIFQYDNLTQKYYSIQKTISKMNTKARSDVEKIEQNIVGLNNQLGWISVALVPNLNYVFNSKDIFKYTQEYNSGDFESKNEKLINSIGSMQYPKKKLQLDAISNIKTDDIGWWEKLKHKFTNLSISTTLDSSLNKALTGLGIDTMVGWGASKMLYFILPGFGELYTKIKNAVFDNGGNEKQISQKAIDFLSSKMTNLFAPVLILKTILPNGIMQVIISYLIAIFVYTFMLTAISLILITSLLILKIVYYFIEIIISIFISKAILLWSLVFDEQQAMSSAKDFAYKIALLIFSPIAIVLSVYVFIFAKAIMYYVYGIIMEASYKITKIASGIDTNTIGGAFTSVVQYSVYSFGSIILTFVSLFIAFNVFFHFYDWMLSYFGHKGEAGIAKSANSVLQEIKMRTMRTM